MVLKRYSYTLHNSEYHTIKKKKNNTHQKFKEIHNAYSILSDSEKLSEYKRKNPATSSSSSRSYASYGFHFDYDSFFSQFSHGFEPPKPPPPPPQNTQPQASPPPPEKKPSMYMRFILMRNND